MRVRCLRLLIAVFAFAPALHGQGQKVKVRHCPAADSALGLKSAAWKGDVISSVGDDGVIHVRGAPAKGRFTVIGSVRVEARTWTEIPPLALSVFVRGTNLDGLVGLGREPNVTVIVDDSVSLAPAAVQLGTFVGPAVVPKALITLPISTLLNPAEFLTLARARSAYVKVEHARVNAPPAELRNIQALYAVLACGTLD